MTVSGNATVPPCAIFCHLSGPEAGVDYPSKTSLQLYIQIHCNVMQIMIFGRHREKTRPQSVTCKRAFIGTVQIFRQVCKGVSSLTPVPHMCFATCCEAAAIVNSPL